MSKKVSLRFSKSWVFVLILFWIPFSLFSQKLDNSYFSPDEGENFISIYLVINDLRVSKSNSKTDDLDTLIQLKRKKKVNSIILLLELPPIQFTTMIEKSL